MSANNRASLLTKTIKVAKKHYKPIKPPADRSVMEHLLFACCLENAKHDEAEQAFAKVHQTFFDLNEIRVTTVAELAESMTVLPDRSSAATRLKRCLQSVFETYYSFDLEQMKKENIGKAVKDLERLDGSSDFIVAYVVQNGLGGHSIPVGRGLIDAMLVLDVISEAEAKKGRVPGLERAIPKTKGAEVGSLLHQLGTDYRTSPFGTKIRGILQEIDPSVKDRLPKRASKEEQAAAAKTAVAKAKAKAKATRAKKAASKKKTTDKAAAPKAKKKAAPAKKKKAVAKRSTTKQLSRKKPR